uniref:Uncharacterized protein n=1 Tax=Streptomyces kanamyceticus TaxID=1967 RepID=Q1EQS4_STRKN|nr:hypothetical protein [Streptomyces kanamyceticus]
MLSSASVASYSPRERRQAGVSHRSDHLQRRMKKLHKPHLAQPLLTCFVHNANSRSHLRHELSTLNAPPATMAPTPPPATV